jgi:5'-nucleotidase (lipoprotein e(P4) family)
MKTPKPHSNNSRNAFLLSLVLLTSLAWGCRTIKKDATPEVYVPQYNIEEHLMQAALFMQNASEYRALCYQTYNSATESLDKILATTRFAKPPSVVLDIDETVLDNSPYTGYQIKNGQPYTPETWKQWTDKAVADTMAGVGTFLHHAKSKGVTIFYVSNRDVSELPATVANLQKMGLPDADTNHVFLRVDVSTKQPRRDKILETNAIAMLFGDNLNDLSDVFESLPTKDRQAKTDAMRDYFGKTWFVLPNPSYGSWNSALFNYQRGLSPKQQDSLRQTFIRSFE